MNIKTFINKHSWATDLLFLTIIVSVLFGTTLASYPLAAPDGARYAEIPREMVATGDYITPHLNGIKYFEKPPLFYWLQAASIKVFGVNDFAVSFVNALMALGSVLLIYWTSRKIYGRASGIIASFIFATSSLVFALTRIITLDFALTFFLTLCLSSFLLATELPEVKKRNIYFWLAYLAAGLAFMTKGLVGIVLPGLILFSWVTIFNQWRNIKHYSILTGLMIFLLVTLPWHILVQLKNPEFSRFYFIEQHFLRYLTDYAGRAKKWWFFPAVFAGGLYPWIVFLPQAITHHIPKKLKEWHYHKQSIFLLLWIFIVYFFYTFSNSKLIPYLLPTFSPIAILIGNYFATYWQKKQHSSINIGFNILFTLNIILAIAGVVSMFVLDFSEQTITKQNLYTVSIIMVVSAISSFIAYRRYGLDKGFYVIACLTAGLWLYLTPVISIINKQSIKPLIMVLKEQIQPKDEVICYDTYYQDLPFYLQRRVIIANFQGELEFGIKHQDTKGWIINTKELIKHWQSNKRVFLITDSDGYRSLHSILPKNKIYLITKHLDDILIVNTKK